MKKCVYCGEEIQDEAVKCRYCGEWLEEAKTASDPASVAGVTAPACPDCGDPDRERELAIHGVAHCRVCGRAIPPVPHPREVAASREPPKSRSGRWWVGLLAGIAGAVALIAMIEGAVTRAPTVTETGGQPSVAPQPATDSIGETPAEPPVKPKPDTGTGTEGQSESDGDSESSHRILSEGEIRSGGPAYMLAAIDNGGVLFSDDAKIARFGSLLRQLDVTFVENKTQIGDMTVVAQEQLKKKGIEESLLRIMEGMNKVFVRKVENQEYAEYVAMYVVFRDKGMSHQEAIEGLRGILEGFGVE